MRRVLTNLFICGFLSAQLILMVTCYARDAKFFGWQMFSYGTVYRIQVFVVDREGVKRPLEMPAYRMAVGEFSYHYVRPSDTPRVFSRGTRFLVSETERLPAFLCRALNGYRSVEVTIDYREPDDMAATQRAFTGACDG